MRTIKFHTDQSKDAFHFKLNAMYEEQRECGRWTSDTQFIKKKGKYYVRYHSGKNSYIWSVVYNEVENTIELRHTWNIADYLMWIPLLFIDLFFIGFCLIYKIWMYIPIFFIVCALVEVLPYYLFVIHLGEKSVTKFMKQHFTIW